MLIIYMNLRLLIKYLKVLNRERVEKVESSTLWGAYTLQGHQSLVLEEPDEEAEDERANHSSNNQDPLERVPDAENVGLEVHPEYPRDHTENSDDKCCGC